MGREVPLALSDTETTYVTMYLEAYVTDPKGAVVALDPPQILAALQLIGRRVREKEMEFWAACEAQQQDDPTFHLGPLAYVEKRAKEVELETDYWFSDHVKERKAAQAAQIEKIQARTEEARSRKVQRDEFLASTQTASSVLNSTSVRDRDDFLRTAGCTDEEIDDVELSISNHVRVLAEQWRSEQSDYVPVYGMVSVKAFGEGRDPHVATEGVVDLVNRTVRNASARISLAAEIAELQADKLRRRSAQDEIVPPTKSSRAGAKQSYEVVAGGTTTTGASRGISRVSKKPDRMTPHHKGRGGDSSTSSDGSDDSERSALKERRKGKAAKVEPRTKDELLSIIRNEARGIHSPTRTDREIYARQLFNEMSPSDRQQYEAEAVKRTPARKPDAVSLKDRLAKWAAREKDGGTIAALVHHNMAGGGHLDPMTGGGDDFLDGERDTVAESDLGGRKRYYEPILDKGEHLARMTTSAQQKAWNLKGNAQRMMAAEQLRGPYGRGFGVYSAQRHQCLLAMLQHLAMDQFLYSRGLKVMNCDRELMAALLVILSALDPKKGKSDIPWEEIPRFETLLIDMHAMAELLCSKRMVPWTLGMIVVTLTATPVEWAELDANFRPSMVNCHHCHHHHHAAAVGRLWRRLT